jgi:hypothetical protein
MDVPAVETVLEVAEGPVIPGLEMFELEYAKDQPEYRPLRALRSMAGEGAILTRWTLTPEQRQAIAAGADVFLEVLTFAQPLQPVLLFVGPTPDVAAWANRYALLPPT